MGATVGFLLLMAFGAWFWLNRGDPEPVPNALPAPSPTTIRSDGDSPTVTRPEAPVDTLPAPIAGEPDDEISPGTEREVGGGASPWDKPNLTNLVTGDPLAEADYTSGITEVARLLAAGVVGFELVPPTLLSAANDVDLEEAEANQPFAARGVLLEGEPIGDMWIFAAPAGGSGPVADYLDAARSEWPVEAALGQVSTTLGHVIHLAASPEEFVVWVEHGVDRLVVVWVPVATNVGVVAAIIDGLSPN